MFWSIIFSRKWLGLGCLSNIIPKSGSCRCNPTRTSMVLSKCTSGQNNRDLSSLATSFWHFWPQSRYSVAFSRMSIYLRDTIFGNLHSLEPLHHPLAPWTVFLWSRSMFHLHLEDLSLPCLLFDLWWRHPVTPANPRTLHRLWNPKSKASIFKGCRLRKNKFSNTLFEVVDILRLSKLGDTFLTKSFFQVFFSTSILW